MSAELLSGEMAINGAAETRFARVREVFEQNFLNGEELGASFALCIDGAVVVDLKAGAIDRKKTLPWRDETIACVYSSGKAIVALLVARAVGEGVLDYSKPVADYWPEFAAAGKQDVTVGEALSHQAGLCGFPDETPADIWIDWQATTDKLAAMAPLWRLGEGSGYHPQTYGFIAGELLRRVTGKSVGALIRDAWGRESLYCGLKPDEMARASYMSKPPAAPDLGEITDLTKAAFLTPWASPSGVAREAWMAAEIPASNMHANALALARALYPFANQGAGLDGERFASADGIAAALAAQVSGRDKVLPFDITWAAGVMANASGHFGPSASAFGHSGFGGSSVCFDPAYGLSMAYVMNKMSPALVGDARAVRLFNAVYECL